MDFRAGLLTGQYAHTPGILDNTARNERSHRLSTFPKQLHDQGYATAFIGKWHMGNDDSKRPGFDYWVSLKGQGEAIDPALNINGEQKSVKGYVTDILTDHSLQFINQKRDRPFLLYLAQKALHPNLMQRDDGRIVDLGEGGFIPAERYRGIMPLPSSHAGPTTISHFLLCGSQWLPLSVRRKRSIWQSL